MEEEWRRKQSSEERTNEEREKQKEGEGRGEKEWKERWLSEAGLSPVSSKSTAAVTHNGGHNNTKHP